MALGQLFVRFLAGRRSVFAFLMIVLAGMGNSLRAGTITRYTVESFAIVEEPVARQLADSLKAQGLDPKILKRTSAENTTYVVNVGTYLDKNQAVNVQEALNRQRFMFVVSGVEVEIPSPELLSVTLEDEDHAQGAGPGDRIVFTFNMPVSLGGKIPRRGTLDEISQAIGVFSDLNLTSTDAALYERGERIVLVLGGLVKQSGRPAGVFVPSSEFVKDLYGQGAQSKATVPLVGNFDDQRPPRLESVVLEDGDQQPGAGPGDRVVFNFSKPVMLMGAEIMPGLSGSWDTVFAYMGKFSKPGTVTASNVRLLVEGKRVSAVLGGTVKNGTPPGGEFLPNASIRDLGEQSRPVQEYAAQVKGTFNDSVAPTLMEVSLVDNAGPAGPAAKDLLVLVYSETLDPGFFKSKKRSGAATTLLGQLVLLGGKPGFEASNATLVLNGAKVTLTLGGKVRGAFQPSALKARPGSVKDLGGNALTDQTPVQVKGSWRDTLPARLVGVRLQDYAGDAGPGPGDLIAFTFNKTIRVKPKKDVDSCPVLMSLIGRFANGNPASGVCKMVQRDREILIYLGPNTTLSGGVLPQLPFQTPVSLKDGAGNAVKPLEDLQISGTLNDAAPPKLVAILMEDKTAAMGFGRGDRITFEFNEAIDTAASKGKFTAQMTLKAAVAVLGVFEKETGADQVMVNVLVKGKRVILEQADGPALDPVGGSFVLTAGSVIDASGNPAVSTTVRPQGTYDDRAPPRLVSIFLEDVDGRIGAGAGDRLILIYNEAVQVVPMPPEGLSVDQLLKGFGAFDADARLEAPKAALSVSGSRVILTLQSQGGFKSKDPNISAGSPPKQFKSAKGVVSDLAGNLKNTEETVPVAGNFNDSRPPALSGVLLKDGDYKGGVGKGDKIVLQFTEPVRLLVPVTKLTWAQFLRYIGRFDKGGPQDGTVTLRVQQNEVVATFQDTPAMTEEPQSPFHPVAATFVDLAKNPLEKAPAAVMGSFSDKIAPKLLSVTLMDGDQKPQLGKGDSLLFEYSEPLTGSKSRGLAKTSTLGDILSALGDFSGLPEGAKNKKAQALVQKSEVFVLVLEDTGEVVDTPKVFAPKGGSVDDEAGNTLLGEQEAVKVKGSFKDGVPPRLARVVMRDVDGVPGPSPGDTIRFEFSETVNWLVKVPEKGSVKKVLAAVGSFTQPRGFELVQVEADTSEKGLVLTVKDKVPGSRAPVGRFILRSSVVKDLAGNIQIEPSSAVVDGDFERDVPPSLVSIRYQDNNQDGLINKDDRIFFEYSKAMEGVNLIKVGELTRMLAQLGETRLDRGFNASECWLTVRGGTIQILVGGRMFGESRIFDTFDSQSEILKDAWQNALKPTKGVPVTVQSGRGAKPLSAQGSTVQVVALVQTYDNQNLAIQLQDRLLGKEIASLIKSKVEKGLEVFMVIAPLPEDPVRREEVLGKITDMGFSPSLILVSNRFVTP